MKYEQHLLGLGCMGLGGGWNDKPHDMNHVKQARIAVDAALEAGIRLFDHADIYARGKAESVFGELLKSEPGLREHFFIQTKCGIRLPGDPPGSKQGRYDFSRGHILHAVENSLKRLQLESIDLLLLHRPDPLVEPEEVAEAFEELKKSGKVKEFGVSNHTPAQMALLRKYLPMHLKTNQVEFHLLYSDMLDGGIAGVTETLDPSGVEGTIEYCRTHDIRLQAWSPAARGLLSGAVYRGRDKNLQQRIENCGARVRELAAQHEVSPEAVVVAWVHHHPAKILPILGSRNPERIRRCAGALEVKLRRYEWYELYCLGRGSGLP